MKKVAEVFVLILIVSLIGGCSGNSVITPEHKEIRADPKVSFMPVGATDFDENGNPSGGIGFLGLFSCHVDKSSMTGEITSLRKASLEDVLEVVDITNFLQLAPCADCVDIKRIQLDGDENLVVSIGIRHPFEPGDPLKPITGRNRADLHVFNVEGIVVSDGGGTTEFPALGVTSGGFRLLNADGYTSYLDASLDEILSTEADIHPFITHFADYSVGNYDPGNPMGFASVTDPPPSGNLVMPMGSDEDVRDYVFDLQDGDMSFIFAVGCTYAVSSASKSQRFTPEYRVPQHNKKAASFVNVIIDNNELEAGEPSSEAQLTIQVLDINHGVPVGTSLNEMKADSSVSKVEVEVPGVTDGATQFSNITLGGDGRDPGNPLIFSGTIANELAAGEGIYPGIVKILDAYPAGLNSSPLLNGMDGIKRVDPIVNPLTGLFTINEFATYQYFEISVELRNLPPVAILAPDPALGCDGERISFNGSASYDTDGIIVSYEFDFDLLDGDPLNFNPDVSGVDPIARSSPYNVGSYTAALRVTDDFGASTIDTVPVTISLIDGFDVTPYAKVYVTDTTFSNVIFTPNGFTPEDTQNQQFGLEAMAKGSQYIYAIFHATGSSGIGLYIARSDDNGNTWDEYNLVRATTTGATFQGAAIDAVGEKVYIAIGESSPTSLYFAYNDNHAEGTFTITQISNTQGYCSTTIAVDPADTNNIYIGVGEQSFWHHFEHYWFYISNSGPSGPFNSTRRDTYYRPPPYNSHVQAYTGEFKVAPDRDVYYLIQANYYIEVFKSNDFGANFTTLYQGYDFAGAWGRDSDYCFNPNDPEMIHWVVTYRMWYGGTDYRFRSHYRRSIDGGSTWNIINNDLHNSILGYTNTAVTTDKNGNLYIVYSDRTPGNAEIFGRYSSNNGLTLDPYFQISDDPLNDGHVEIVQTLNGCDVIIGWLEDRDGARRVVSRRG